jgi:hypothetical protein
MLATEIHCEAQRYCDRKGITDYETFQKVKCSIAQERYLKAIEPYTQLKVRILSTRMVDRMIYDGSDALPQITYKPFPLALEAALRGLDDLIETEAEYFRKALHTYI